MQTPHINACDSSEKRHISQWLFSRHFQLVGAVLSVGRLSQRCPLQQATDAKPLGVMVNVLPQGIGSIISLSGAVSMCEISSGDYVHTLWYWVNRAQAI